MLELPALLPRLAAWAVGAGYWLASKIWPSGAPTYVTNLSDAINMVWEALRTFITEIVRVRTFDQAAMGDAGNNIDNIGGAVEAVGQNQHALWHHLRYIMMPNTIQAIWNFVLRAWILPLRQHVGILVRWCQSWFGVIWYNDAVFRQWTHDIIAAQRNWRATYIYPQLQWLMSPPRVAYWYAQAFLTEISQYLAYPGHDHDRDAIARAVIDTSPRLWRHTEQAILAFLEQPIDSSGMGSSLPQRPAWATQPPPDVPPTWEAWITQPHMYAYPDNTPRIPEQDPGYDGV